MTTQDRPALIQRLRWFADNTGDGELFVQAADMLEAADLTATGKQSLQVAQQESKQEQSNGHGRHDEIRHDHHGDISLDSGAINSAAGKQDLSLTYTTGHCENHKQKGGCQLHNLQCGWPNCDRKPTGPTPIPQPAVPKEHDLHDAIMNIQANPDKTAGVNFQLAYKKGHRDARHAAAELAIAAPGHSGQG